MKDLVIPLGRGGTVEDIELRYCLRSVEKHIKNVRNVVIVGFKPDWIKGIIHLPTEDDHACKETNIYRKVLLACQDPDITEDFLFFNDDHFILQDFDADNFPFFYKGDLLFVLKHLPPYNKYSTCVHKTAYKLKELGLETKNFDTHTPILYNKQKFIEVMTQHDWAPRFGYVVKSLYANQLKIEGVKEPDCKMNDFPSIESFYERIKERKVFSIGGGALCDGLKYVWDELYPIPSRWE